MLDRTFSPSAIRFREKKMHGSAPPSGRPPPAVQVTSALQNCSPRPPARCVEHTVVVARTHRPGGGSMGVRDQGSLLPGAPACCWAALHTYDTGTCCQHPNRRSGGKGPARRATRAKIQELPGEKNACAAGRTRACPGRRHATGKNCMRSRRKRASRTRHAVLPGSFARFFRQVLYFFSVV